MSLLLVAHGFELGIRVNMASLSDQKMSASAIIHVAEILSPNRKQGFINF